MLPNDPQLKPYYRMPRVFGALPGPRNIPADKQQLENAQRNTTMAVTARTEHAALEALLPPGCELSGEPLFTVSLVRMENIAWLAGRGYSMLIVAFRIAHKGREGAVVPGNFIPVLWENMAEPILTGREELGFAKLYADLPRPTVIGCNWHARGVWDGFCFCDIEVSGVADAPLPHAPAIGNYHYKFIPRNTVLGQGDIDQVVYAEPGSSQAGYNLATVQRFQSGEGRFSFHRPRWEDMPFQYTIINALADLPVLEFVSASLSFASASGPAGDPTPGALRPCGPDWP